MNAEVTDGKKYALRVHDSFSQSEYGQSLSNKPRWDMQRPEHVSPEEWIALLGRDADNLQHMRLTFDITNLFIHFDDGSLDLSEEEKGLLQLASMIHDWGESYDPTTGIGGDIGYETKTTRDSSDETEMFERVFNELIGEDELKLRFIMESIIFKKDNKLGQIFNAIEKVGYLRTAKIAYDNSKTQEDEILKSHLQWLAAGTLANQVIPLMEYSANYTPVKKYLDQVAPFIDEVFDSTKSSIFAEHGQIQHEKIHLFNQSKIAWQRGFSHAPSTVEGRSKSIFSDTPNFEGRFVEDYETLEGQVRACRTLGLKIVLTSGSFDLMHIGHMRYVEKASEYGDVLIVGVDSDAKIRKRKGPDRPVVDEKERTQMLSHVRGVNLITLKSPDEARWELIRRVHPDILIATAETYKPEEIIELEAGYCGRVVVLEPQATTSTSARIRNLNIGWSKKAMLPLLQGIEEGLPNEVLKERAKDVLGNS